MSARSRALQALADHCTHQAQRWERQFPGAQRPVYTGADLWLRAADMAHRTALENRWRERVPRFIRRRILRRRIW